jgi:hypothetical protein
MATNMPIEPADVEKPAIERLENDHQNGFSHQPPRGYRFVEIDPVVQKRILRKTDRVLVTLVFLACTPPSLALPRW